MIKINKFTFICIFLIQFLLIFSLLIEALYFKSIINNRERELGNLQDEIQSIKEENRDIMNLWEETKEKAKSQGIIID